MPASLSKGQASSLGLEEHERSAKRSNLGGPPSGDACYVGRSAVCALSPVAGRFLCADQQLQAGPRREIEGPTRCADSMWPRDAQGPGGINQRGPKLQSVEVATSPVPEMVLGPKPWPMLIVQARRAAASSAALGFSHRALRCAAMGCPGRGMVRRPKAEQDFAFHLGAWAMLLERAGIRSGNFGPTQRAGRVASRWFSRAERNAPE